MHGLGNDFVVVDARETSFKPSIEQARHMGRALVGDIPCNHYWYRSAAVDFEFWIAEGEFPLLRRMVIRYLDRDARPSYRALFSEWDLEPELSATEFSFEPADGAKAVGFDALVEVM